MLLQGSPVIFFFSMISLQGVVGQKPKFRILAPQFICPKDDNAAEDKPDNTIITIQTAADSNFNVMWTVRWTPLPKPSQRFTLLLWRAVRALEVKLNGPQLEPFVYVIENAELLIGVDYIFDVRAVEADGELSIPETFHIDNTQGKHKLNNVDGLADLLSIILLGGNLARADMEFELEAQVTSCVPTQDYYFLWTVRSTETEEKVNVSQIVGSTLKIPPHSLNPGSEYYANCQVIKPSTGDRITQIGLHIEVLPRRLQVFLNVDFLIMTINKAFTIDAVINNDYYTNEVLFKWECKSEEDCDFFETQDNSTISFPSGLPRIGQYIISVSISTMEEATTATATIVTVDNSLPIIQVTPTTRVVNEGSFITLIATASNVAPTCTLTWYFASEEYLLADAAFNDTCDDCQHGEAVSDALTVFSLEENFLNELTDFSNETEWRQVTATLPASAGRARFLAQCGCSITFECKTNGITYADLKLILNESPKAEDIMISVARAQYYSLLNQRAACFLTYADGTCKIEVSPESGTALETIFRISTLAVIDPDTPLRYSFYCSVGTNDTLLLQTYMEHLAVEVLLPYIDSGIEIWVEVCDALGACSSSEPKLVTLSPGEGLTLESLIDTMRGHTARCELLLLHRLAVSAIVTYINADQPDFLKQFTSTLVESLQTIVTSCKENNFELYSSFLQWLLNAGVDVNDLI